MDEERGAHGGSTGDHEHHGSARTFSLKNSLTSQKEGGFSKHWYYLKLLMLWMLRRWNKTSGLTRLGYCSSRHVIFMRGFRPRFLRVVVAYFDVNRPLLHQRRCFSTRLLVVVVVLYSCLITHRWCPPSGSPSADRHDIHLFNS